MSASLVGSEMCIRDRPGVAVLLKSRSPSSLAMTRERSGRSRSPPPSRTVSYTHLTLPTICSV
eukprot:1590257-Alexandrium_andersonii.AAC.1